MMEERKGRRAKVGRRSWRRAVVVVVLVRMDPGCHCHCGVSACREGEAAGLLLAT
jgi:hypothetical protein